MLRESSHLTVSAKDFALLVARPETRITFSCVAAMALGLILGFRHAWPLSAWVVLIGGVLAIVGMIRFGMMISSVSSAGPGAHAGLGGVLPYLYGLYLVAYEGFWGLRSLLQLFTVLHLMACLAFIYLGYRIVYWNWQMTEIADGLRKGRIVVNRAAPDA